MCLDVIVELAFHLCIPLHFKTPLEVHPSVEIAIEENPVYTIQHKQEHAAYGDTDTYPKSGHIVIIVLLVYCLVLSLLVVTVGILIVSVILTRLLICCCRGRNRLWLIGIVLIV